jgi:hypothetical protein
VHFFPHAFRNREGAEEAVRGYNEAHRGPGKWTVHDIGKTEKVWTIPITPALRKALTTEPQPIAERETPELPKFPLAPWQGIASQALGGQAT